MSKSAILKSSLAKKYWMAGTGLFLCLFLVGHLAGNLQLFMSGEAGRLQFNEYAKFMTSNPLVKLLSYLTYFSLLFHAIDGIALAIQNRKARPVQYSYNKPSANSSWASRKMALLGSILLAFIAVHMTNFWAKMHFVEIPMQTLDDGSQLKDLHTIVLAFFNPEQNSLAWLATAFYVVSMLVLAFHLSHGFQSAFQSLGLRHPKYTPIIKKVGVLFAWVLPILFASIPLYLFMSAN